MTWIALALRLCTNQRDSAETIAFTIGRTRRRRAAVEPRPGAPASMRGREAVPYLYALRPKTENRRRDAASAPEAGCPRDARCDERPMRCPASGARLRRARREPRLPP